MYARAWIHDLIWNGSIFEDFGSSGGLNEFFEFREQDFWIPRQILYENGDFEAPISIENQTKSEMSLNIQNHKSFFKRLATKQIYINKSRKIKSNN